MADQPRGIKTIIYPVHDMTKAKDTFRALLGGTEPYIDESYYAAFDADGQDVGLDPNGHDKGLTGPTVFWHVPDIAARLEALAAAGAEIVQKPQDVGGGNLTATVRDANGNVTGLFQVASAPSDAS
ncbi:VOC family protein [Streptomyces fuscigenes]|uniref:VOC family protein n=1 Tax=Streptomyces fuscigenes TaxID=1528880 RepID=UPI001F1F9B0B|nr:VOC family protein [Streptomyces fuscigenes]MCF3960773.1 glyoxalase [Streptomyces fuscigenes]